jgi:hypothetical protein
MSTINGKSPHKLDNVQQLKVQKNGLDIIVCE